MKRQEFVRCTPESVGISSDSVRRFLNRMDDGFTEMHSLMIMRHGKICAEGWWSPYAPGLRHTMMSQTKTFTGTAIGIALKEGILTLHEKIADIFPEYLPENPSSNLLSITIRDLLCMGSGMEEASPVDENWLKNFFSTPVVHKPGTAFFYNDSAVTLLSAIIRRKTGMHIKDYLKPRLFDKIGIDADALSWFNVADGTAFGAGGLHCSTEDVLRLMKLYLNGGVWEGERILTEEYVKAATSVQNSTSRNTTLPQGLPNDNQYGYGYLMWMSHLPGVYRAEGAFGQITLVDPSRDLILSFTESTRILSPASQESLDRCWEFIEEIEPSVHTLPEAEKKAAALQKQLASLSVQRDPYAPFGAFPFPGKEYTVQGQGVHPENIFYSQLYLSPETAFITGITSFSFCESEPRLIRMTAQINGHLCLLEIPTDGSRKVQELDEYYVSKVALSGYWKDTHTFSVRFRWIETVFVKELSFRFEDKCCLIHEEAVSGQFSTLKEEETTAVLDSD